MNSGNRKNFIPLHYEMTKEGRLIAATTFKYSWRFQLGEKIHTVEFVLNNIFGTKEILVDGQRKTEIDTVGAFLSDDINIEFYVDTELINLFAKDNEYDLKVRKQLFSLMLKESKKNLEKFIFRKKQGEHGLLY